MPSISLPRQAYYSSLSGFQKHFSSGTPVLLYHKVGPLPKGALRKALTISPQLFSRQLEELRRAGFSAGRLDEAFPETNAARRVMITFDDGLENVFRHALAPLAENGMRAIQFLIPGLLGGCNEWDLPDGEVSEKLMDAAQIRDWLAAGHEIGSHSMTHPNLTSVPIAQAREEIFASKKSLEDAFGVPIVHFCYPYGAWNPAIRDLVAEAGYRTACTTERGVNSSSTNSFEIKRWLARYPSFRPKEVLARVIDRMV